MLCLRAGGYTAPQLQHFTGVKVEDSTRPVSAWVFDSPTVKDSARKSTRTQLRPLISQTRILSISFADVGHAVGDRIRTRDRNAGRGNL